jgi:hypothetical protein
MEIPLLWLYHTTDANEESTPSLLGVCRDEGSPERKDCVDKFREIRYRISGRLRKEILRVNGFTVIFG